MEMELGSARPKDASVNTGAPLDDVTAVGPRGRVSGMQTKLHGWAAADPGRRFDDLFNFVYDPATLPVAFERVAGNHGAATAGIDGTTVADLERELGVPGFLEDLRVSLKEGTFRPLPVRQRMIPKPGGSGKLRKLGIPTIATGWSRRRASWCWNPSSRPTSCRSPTGSGPGGGRTTAIADIQRLGSQGYHWVLEADIEACFDAIDHTALLGRVRARVKDKRVLALVKAFLKAGIMTEIGHREDSDTGTPQGGVLSPLLANIALSRLDEYVMAPWRPDGTMGSSYRATGAAPRAGRPGGLSAMRT
jgi:RNA-directed DNA polymerase